MNVKFAKDAPHFENHEISHSHSSSSSSITYASQLRSYPLMKEDTISTINEEIRKTKSCLMFFKTIGKNGETLSSIEKAELAFAIKNDEEHLKALQGLKSDKCIIL